ncbi:MAG TPA: thioredoxin domain-containing protein, partial [Sulfurovum sp.]|nr:thioredoxin domain-containing protein [Sulfurovum sp.]
MKSIILGAIMLASTINANDLKNEQSPYLLQHKDNPVSWVPWNKDTLELALKQDKLIFLSVGYSTCHWCHVMEEESFEDKEVAKVLNKDYISIKVDREEMPQLDSFYQSVYQTMNRRGGGWPLTIIMTADKKAFWSGTYIPKKNLIGLLSEISNIYKNDRQKIIDSANELHEIANKTNTQDIQVIDSDLQKTINTFTKAVSNGFDSIHGGHGGAPKFPRATMLEAMLDLYSINGDKKLLEMTNFTLKAMAEGGIYDQIESGFYRYSVDAQWLIPHFEKMLYTQAELLSVYTKAYLITADKQYKTIINDLISFIDKKFTKDDLLYSASDADSMTEAGHKEEGYYFVFKYEDTHKYLAGKDYSLADTKDILEYFHITKNGNFEHEQTNPHIAKNQAIKNLQKVKKDLEELRAKKKYPFVDNKIQTSWNAMYISSLFGAAKIDTQYGDRAIKLLNTLIDNMYINNTLYHQKLIGKKLKVKALFEDYAFLIDSLTEAYQYSYDKRYIVFASILAKDGIKKFY